MLTINEKILFSNLLNECINDNCLSNDCQNDIDNLYNFIVKDIIVKDIILLTNTELINIIDQNFINFFE